MVVSQHRVLKLQTPIKNLYSNMNKKTSLLELIRTTQN